ncbi:MAG: transglycosylase domain-containing protein, partial [Verrucomicrobiota bacterium]
MAEEKDKDDLSGEQDIEDTASEERLDDEKVTTEEPSAEESSNEESEAEDAIKDADDVEEEASEKKKRPLAVRLLLGFTKFCLFLILYVTLGAVAAGGGFGWYYLDQNTHHDLSKVEELSTGAEVVDAHGAEIGRIGATDRKLITREDIPDTFIDALLAAEDQRYFSHPGFDPIGTLRAALANYRAETIREGGSTLTQQLARDVFGLEGRHIERKLNEIAIAFWIEREYSKDEVLVHYLNRIYFGSGFYGVGAAANGYFDKPLRELTVDESAMLCGLIRSPSRLSPYVSRERAMGARNQTLARMVSIGRLTQAEMDEIVASPTPVADNRDQKIHRGQTSFLLARIEKETRELIGDRSLEGLRIQSSVDLEFQQATAYAIDRHLKKLSREKSKVEGIDDLEGAAIVVENRTGRILLTVGSRDFGGSEYDRSRDMKRPPGSAFIPFVYAAAFESGEFGPDSILADAPFDNREMGLGGNSGVLGEWSTENPENRWTGSIRAADALRLCKNSPTARLGLQVGLERVSELASRAGIETPIRELSGSLLGASEMALSELVRAYTIFPNEGMPSPRLGLIESIRAGEETVYSSDRELSSDRVISSETAHGIA